VLRAKDRLTNCQGSLHQPYRFMELTSLGMQNCQIVQAPSGIGMHFP
jgi:hypothetical protein